MLTNDQALVLSSSTGGVLAEDYHTHYHKNGVVTAKVLLMESGTTIVHVTSTAHKGQKIAPQSLYQVAKRYANNPVCVSVGGGNGLGGKYDTRVYSDLESE